MLAFVGAANRRRRNFFPAQTKYLGSIRFIAALCVSAAPCLAQNTGERRPTSETPRGILPPSGVTFLRGITMTPAQKVKWDEIRVTYSARYKTFVTTTNAVLKAAKRKPGPQERSDAQRLRDENVAAIRAILTSVQQQQFDQNLRTMQQSTDSVRRAMQTINAASTATADQGLRFVPPEKPPVLAPVPNPTVPASVRSHTAER
jgi:hypothetical protein